MVTVYDYSLAKIIDRAGIDMVLIGDSLANVVMGVRQTRDVTFEVMRHHAASVARAVRSALVVADLPYVSAHAGAVRAVADARGLISVGCDAVKIEWFDGCLPVVEALVSEGIAVMGHVGLTPQTAHETGGFRAQGRRAGEAKAIYDQVMAQQKNGCFAVVLECVADRVAAVISREAAIPTIGIGSGPGCDGQVLVLHDLLGIFDDYHPKFAKCYAPIGQAIEEAVQAYCREVASGVFPGPANVFHVEDQEFQQFLDGLDR